MVRQREWSPGEPGCCAMLVYETPQEREDEQRGGENEEIASHFRVQAQDSVDRMRAWTSITTRRNTRGMSVNDDLLEELKDTEDWTDDEGEVRELTRADFARMKPFSSCR